MQVALLLDDGIGVVVVFFLLLLLLLAVRGELLAVADVPLGDEVVLDPDDLADGADKGRLALQAQLGVGHDGVGQDVLDEAQAGAHVDVLDVQGVLAAEADVHHADFIEVLPQLRGAGVRAQLVEVGAQEELAVLDLRGSLVEVLLLLLLLWWLLLLLGCAAGGHGRQRRGGDIAWGGGAARRQGARCEVIGQELLVDDVDDGRDELLEVLGA